VIQYCGSIAAPVRGPILYFIWSYNILYIGETQKHPVERWNSHLSPQGTFREKLAAKGDPEVDYLSDVKLFAYHCHSLAKTFPQPQWKTATQAVEHEVHCYVLQHPSKFREQFILISDTEKTAPRRFKHWGFARQLSEQLATAFANEIAGNYRRNS
jgi:hypothetical protein